MHAALSINKPPRRTCKAAANWAGGMKLEHAHYKQM